MKRTIPKYPRMLAIAPSTRGFGFALVEGLNTLVDWGVKLAEGDKNSQSLRKAKELIALYQPDVIVLQDTSAKPLRHSLRIRNLTKRIIRMSERRGMRQTRQVDNVPPVTLSRLGLLAHGMPAWRCHYTGSIVSDLSCGGE